MKKRVESTITIENTRIFSRNFSGKKGEYNPAGSRNFCVVIGEELAPMLKEDGWNVRYTKPRYEDVDPEAFLQVTVSFTNERKMPKIFLISSKGKSMINEDNVHILDWVEIKEFKLIIRPYNWDVRGETGVKAYLKSLAIIKEEDEIEKEYYDLPDSAADVIGGCGNCDACDGSCDKDGSRTL